MLHSYIFIHNYIERHLDKFRSFQLLTTPESTVNTTPYRVTQQNQHSTRCVDHTRRKTIFETNNAETKKILESATSIKTFKLYTYVDTRI